MARARGYLLSLLLAGLGLGVSLELRVTPGGLQPSFLAVGLTALAGGAGPALVCWALSTVGHMWLVEPTFSFAIASARDRSGLFEFAVEAGFVAVALGTVRALHHRESAERSRALRTADRLARLQAVTAALSAARTAREAARAVLEVTAPLGASAAAVLWRSGEDALEPVAWRGYDAEGIARLGRSGVTGELPVAHACREGRAVFLEAPPAVAPSPLPGAGASAALPLVVDGRPAGALVFDFPAPHAFDAEDRVLLQALADCCAQALQRAFLFDAEQGLRSAAERATRQRDHVLEAVAHDLRSPLNAVQLHADALAARAAVPRDAEALRAIGAAASRMERMVEDLLDDAALDAGRLALHREACDGAALAADAIQAVRPAAERAGVAIELRVGAPAVADCDRGRAVQVLENLLANAVRASPRGGAVSLSVEGRAGAVRFEVRDAGPGIPAAELPHLFDRQRRTRGPRGKGAGLGLAIARALTELHGGRIEATSGVQGGAVFTVELPAAAPSGRVAAMR